MTFFLLLFLTVGPDASGKTAVEAAEAKLAKRQAERVMNAGLPFAEKMLAEHGEFAPFGAILRTGGKIQIVGANDNREAAPVEEIYAQLARGLREGVAAGTATAVATFALVELRRPESGELVGAVHVALEHREGYCVDVYYPKVRQGEHYALGEPFAGRREGAFFDRCTASVE